MGKPSHDGVRPGQIMEPCSRRRSQCGGGEQNLEAPRHVDAPDGATQASLAGRRRSNSPAIATDADGRSRALVLSLSRHKGRGHAGLRRGRAILITCNRDKLRKIGGEPQDVEQTERSSHKIDASNGHLTPFYVPANLISVCANRSGAVTIGRCPVGISIQFQPVCWRTNVLEGFAGPKTGLVHAT